jgi:hypothetical protein
MIVRVLSDLGQRSRGRVPGLSPVDGKPVDGSAVLVLRAISPDEGLRGEVVKDCARQLEDGAGEASSMDAVRLERRNVDLRKRIRSIANSTMRSGTTPLRRSALPRNHPRPLPAIRFTAIAKNPLAAHNSPIRV